jgi:hypothetical protein
VKSEVVVKSFVILGALLAGPMTASAHHSAIAFDLQSTRVIQGTVTEWYWANPHCLLKLEVEGEGGEVVQWVMETQAPANMVDAGWRKNDLRAGDAVTVVLRPAKNGNPVGRLMRVEFADGKTLRVEESRGAGTEYHLSGAPTD